MQLQVEFLVHRGTEDRDIEVVCLDGYQEGGWKERLEERGRRILGMFSDHIPEELAHHFRQLRSKERRYPEIFTIIPDAVALPWEMGVRRIKPLTPWMYVHERNGKPVGEWVEQRTYIPESAVFSAPFTRYDGYHDNVRFMLDRSNDVPYYRNIVCYLVAASYCAMQQLYVA